jgi:hypothetical protein
LKVAGEEIKKRNEATFQCAKESHNAAIEMHSSFIKNVVSIDEL